MVTIPAKKTSKSHSHDELEDLHKKLIKTHSTIKDDQKSIRSTLDELIRVFKEASKTSKLNETLHAVTEQNKHIIELLEEIRGNQQGIKGNQSTIRNSQQDLKEGQGRVPIEDMLNGINTAIQQPQGTPSQAPPAQVPEAQAPQAQAPQAQALPVQAPPPVTAAAPEKPLNIPDYNALMQGKQAPKEAQSQPLPPMPPEPPTLKEQPVAPGPIPTAPPEVAATPAQQTSTAVPQQAQVPGLPPAQPQDAHVMPPPIVNNSSSATPKKKNAFMKELDSLMGKK